LTIHAVELATVLPGAVAFKENNNVTDTYRGQILRSGQAVSAAVIKDLPAKELANELISFILARELDLPIPTAYLTLVRQQDLQLSQAPTLPRGDRLVFASVDVQTPNLAFRYRSDLPGQARLLGAVTAWPPLGRLYGFDAWVANVDRHAGNLLFGSGAEAWLIDHGWAFSGPTWTTSDLVASSEYRHRLGEWLTPHLTDDGKTSRARQAGILESDLSTFDVDGAIAASHASAFLSKDELESVRGFLRARIVEVTRLASKALGMPVII
jgi:hypothetical protein